MIVGTAGHIDHGKTLLVQALTGVETDRLKEEKKRGITIELGFAYIPVPDSQTDEKPDGDILGFVDVPGHERFVHTMVAGACGIDFALLVIAADDGVMPQTREHLQVLDLLGISEGMVVLNKSDLVDEARLSEVEADIKALLAGSRLEGCEIMPVSAACGTGIEVLKARLLEEAASRPKHLVEGKFRMAIDRCFSLQGTGTVVTGAIRSGSINTGDEVQLLPSGNKVRVRSLHAQGRDSQSGFAGERCALNLAGIEKNAIKRGNWLVQPGAAVLTDRFDVELKLLATEERPIRTWSPVFLHIGTTRVRARVVLLEDVDMQPGTVKLVQLVTDRALPVVHGDMFVVRSVGAERTIGGGHIVDPNASRRRRRSPEKVAIRDAHHLADPAEALEALLAVSPGITNLSEFVAGRGLTDKDVDEIIELLELETIDVEGVTYAAQQETVAEISETVSETLREFHERHSDLPGMPERALKAALSSKYPASVFQMIIEILVAKECIATVAGTVRLPDHASSLRSSDQQLWERISGVLEENRRQPPPLHELAEGLKQQISDVRKICKTMVRLGTLVELKKDRFLLKSELVRLGDLAHQIANSKQMKEFTIAEFRDEAECGRAVAVQVLEYFDRRGITGRRGDARIVGKRPSDVLGEFPMS